MGQRCSRKCVVLCSGLHVERVVESLRVQRSERSVAGAMIERNHRSLSNSRFTFKPRFAPTATTFVSDCSLGTRKVISRSPKLSLHLGFDQLNKFSSFIFFFRFSATRTSTSFPVKMQSKIVFVNWLRASERKRRWVIDKKNFSWLFCRVGCK